MQVFISDSCLIANLLKNKIMHCFAGAVTTHITHCLSLSLLDLSPYGHKKYVINNREFS